MFCSYRKEFDKTSRNKFISGCESMCIKNDLMHVALSRVTVKNFNPEPAIGLWWNDAKKTRRLVDAYGSNQQ